MQGKRTWGTGSVSPKADGKWLLRTSHRSTETGERIRINRVVKAQTKREAETMLAAMTGAAPAGRPQRWTMDGWVRHTFGNPELAPRTRETALQTWDLYTSEAFKAIPLRDLAVEDGDKELARMRAVVSRFDRPLAPRTRALWYATVRRALNVALKKRLILANPLLLTDRAPSSDATTERPRWSKEEAARFLATAGGDRLAALWRLLLETGMRPGEAFALRWSDLSGDRLHIRRALIRLRDKSVAFGPTKTHQVRAAALSADLVAALKGHRARQAEERLKAGHHYHSDLDLIFGTELGEPLRHDVTTKQFKRLVKRAKLPTLHLYGLRHTSASLKLEAGVDVQTVSEGLGHKDATTTLRHYVASSTPQQRDASAALSALLAGGAASPEAG